MLRLIKKIEDLKVNDDLTPKTIYDEYIEGNKVEDNLYTTENNKIEVYKKTHRDKVNHKLKEINKSVVETLKIHKNTINSSSKNKYKNEKQTRLINRAKKKHIFNKILQKLLKKIQERNAKTQWNKNRRQDIGNVSIVEYKKGATDKQEKNEQEKLIIKDGYENVLKVLEEVSPDNFNPKANYNEYLNFIDKILEEMKLEGAQERKDNGLKSTKTLEIEENVYKKKLQNENYQQNTRVPVNVHFEELGHKVTVPNYGTDGEIDVEG